MLCEIITIGDEILIGQIVDTNSAWMAEELNKIGVTVKQITSISDTASHIIEALNQAKSRADLILITGGLGPTKDDVTKKTLADYFAMPLRRDIETLAHVEQFFVKLNRPMLDANRAQADVPDGCTVIKNQNGTAPCMWFDVDGRVFVSMPGVPFEMKYLMQEEILPRIQHRFHLNAIIHQTLLTVGIGESFLAERLAHVENALPPHIKLAYLPKLGQVRLRLSATGSNSPQLSQEINYFVQQLVATVGEYIVATADIPLEKVVLDKLEAKGLTLSTAESCTGGYIAHLLTQHAGSSAVYLGGGITYSNDLKTSMLGVKEATLKTFGAVSQQTAKEMAMGALGQFKSDYAIAITGIAGPDGGTPEKPVGTVWIAIAGKFGIITKLYNFTNKRQQNIERAATAALSLLVQQLKQHAD